jgi:hypothetical protein
MIILLITFLLGVITGILLYRNNINKLQKTEAKGKEIINAFKDNSKID